MYETNKTCKMYIIDVFDPKYVKKPGSIDIMLNAFKKRAGFSPNNKDGMDII
jgi:hypothetical protein